MKIKSIGNKIAKFSASGFELSGREFDLLKRGKDVAVTAAIGAKLVASGLVKEVKNKEKSKGK